MTLCGSKVSWRANLALVSLTVLLSSNVGHAAPSTAITTCGVEIESPGAYYLATDLTCPGTGILIFASDVRLRLDGHTLQGLSRLSEGIEVVHATGVVIQGPGTVTGFGDGVSLTFVDSSTVIGVTATGNTIGFFAVGVGTDNNVFQNNVATLNSLGIGVDFGNENMVINNFLMNNSRGIETFVAHRNKFYANTANNGLLGFNLVASTQNEIHGNTALSNSNQDMSDSAPNCDDNQWQGNRFDTANQECIQ
ncbi:MAG TPA: NosD domain-containing protein [Vicinamibacterales bacterium]|nr:NosD domain-containing protein [Vicinamibacterales bacterium]